MEPKTIRAARALTGLSQEDVADALGISTMTVKRAEGSGQPPPSEKTINDIVRFLSERGANIEFDQHGVAHSVRGPGRLRSGKSAAEGYFHEMEIQFDEPIRGMSPRDILLVATPSGQNLRLTPVDVDGDDLLVASFVAPAMSFIFRLRPTGKKTVTLLQEEQHIALHKSGIWDPELQPKEV